MAKLEQTQIGGLLPATVWEMETASAGQIDAVAGFGRGVNLLDNWYFRNPVNQQGQLTYSQGYGIDRWRSNGLTVTLQNSGNVRLVSNNSATTWYQIIKGLNPTSTPFTLSFLTLGGELISHTFTLTNNNFTNYGNLCLQKDANNLLYAGIYLPQAGDQLDLIAAKLEFGNTQTLARKVGNTWVLNDPPPNKESELLRCQQYQIKLTNFFAGGTITSSGNSLYLTLSLPSNLQQVPTVKSFTIYYIIFNGTRVNQPTGLTAKAYNSGSHILLDISKDSWGLTPNHNVNVSLEILLDSNL